MAGISAELRAEIWKDIPGYDGLYQVSNLGNVKSFYYNKELTLKNSLGTSGYMYVNLFKDSNSKSLNIHQLVAMSFLGHAPCGQKLVVDHINNNKTDNRVENLRIVTQRFNASRNKNGSSQYCGVSWNKIKNRWVSRIVINKKIITLGSFKCELAAHIAYLNKLKQIL